MRIRDIEKDIYEGIVSFTIEFEPDVTDGDKAMIAAKIDNYYDATDLTDIEIDDDGLVIITFEFEEDEWGTVEEKADRRMTELENYIEELDV